jgi:hypothetical protein
MLCLQGTCALAYQVAISFSPVQQLLLLSLYRLCPMCYAGVSALCLEHTIDLLLPTRTQQQRKAPLLHNSRSLMHANHAYLYCALFLQVTLYDDQHMSDHIAVVANLSLSTSIEQAEVCLSV